MTGAPIDAARIAEVANSGKWLHERPVTRFAQLYRYLEEGWVLTVFLMRKANHWEAKESHRTMDLLVHRVTGRRHHIDGKLAKRAIAGGGLVNVNAGKTPPVYVRAPEKEGTQAHA